MGIALSYRPQTFGEVYGQTSTVQVFRAIAKTGKYPAAVLLSGTRGTGKTSVARIFARALNCDSLTEQGDPCNQCVSCKGILSKSFTWVVEIDAASNRGIDDMRKLVEKLHYAPPTGKRYVWIIDECHQLTGDAANAFLKILEEPPPYVNFILCTTEEARLIDTIKSRCMKFVFKHVSEIDILMVLKGILSKEKISYQEDALKVIARQAQGSIRDALTLMEPVMLLHSELTLMAVQQSCSAVDSHQMSLLFDAMIEYDGMAVCNKMSELLLSGIDAITVFEVLGRYIHDLAYVTYGVPELVLEPNSVLQRMTEQAKKIGERGVRILMELWADRIRYMQYSDVAIAIVPILLMKYLEEYLNLDQSLEVITKFVVGYEDKVTLVSFGRTCSVLKMQNNLIDIVRFPSDAVDSYYILYSDVVRLGNLKNAKNEIKVRKDKV
mgnify:CR=1 FL=1